MDVGGIGVAAVWINDDGPMTELDIAFEPTSGMPLPDVTCGRCFGKFPDSAF